MSTLPTSATLNGVRLHFRECEACAGTGNRSAQAVRWSDTEREQEVKLECQSCRGRGYHRQLGAFAG